MSCAYVNIIIDNNFFFISMLYIHVDNYIIYLIKIIFNTESNWLGEFGQIQPTFFRVN